MKVVKIGVVLVVILFSLTSAVTITYNEQMNSQTPVYIAGQILEELDLAFNMNPGLNFPVGNPGDIKYNFFLDLENGYSVNASSRIHLYADTARWAIVFETAGYNNRGLDASITLSYVGNCINYPVQEYSGYRYISNTKDVLLIDAAEFERIQNKGGTGMENFELIDPETKEIRLRDTSILFEHDFQKYERNGIKIRTRNNPKKLIGFGDLVRYLNETNPQLIAASEDDIKTHLPVDLKKIMTIEAFHYTSVFDKINPSKQETYQLIAKVLVTRNLEFWKPTDVFNNHWSNWTSGQL